MIRDFENVWISVDYRPPDIFGPSFPLGRELRKALREAGLPASLFSVHDGLEDVLAHRDIVFPIEESYPRDGFESDPAGLRKALERTGARFVGSGSEAVRRTNDKEAAKQVLASGGLLVPGGVCLRDAASALQEARRFSSRFGFPAVLKPVSGRGGSLGVELVAGEEDLLARVRHWAGSASPPLLLEELVAGEEVTAWVMGVEPEVRCLNVLRIDKQGKTIFDRALKAGATLAPSATTLVSSPGRERIGEVAVAAHRLLGAYSYSRVDLIVRDGLPVVLELNAAPVLSAGSEMAMPSGTGRSFGELMAGLVEHARLRGGA